MSERRGTPDAHQEDTDGRRGWRQETGGMHQALRASAVEEFVVASGALAAEWRRNRQLGSGADSQSAGEAR